MDSRKVKSSKVLLIGFALFSMFFGSGNLIFPLIVGREVGQHYIFGALGFILTAVFVPFLGVVTMVVYGGDYRKFFAFLGDRLGFVVSFLLLLFWIPLGSGARCVTLSFASLQKTVNGSIPLWTFSFFYTLLVYIFTYRKDNIIKILGYILTPLLLLCLGVVVGNGIWYMDFLNIGSKNIDESFLVGLYEGYNTMDLVASFFFSSTIIKLLSEETPEKHSSYNLRLVMKSGLVSVCMLGLVYLGLMFVAAAHAPLLENVAAEGLLVSFTYALLGKEVGVVAAIAIALACLTTSIALASVFTEFIHKEIFSFRISYKKCLALTCLLTFLISILGFSAITSIYEPVFKIFYPALMVMILVLVPLKVRSTKNKKCIPNSSVMPKNSF